MTTETPKKLRRLIVPAAVLIAALALAATFRAELVAWFGGEATTSDESAGVTGRLGVATVTVTLDPDPPRQSGNRLNLHLVDADAQPLSDAELEVAYFMPAMGAMPEMRGRADVAARGDGRYEARFDLPMSGTWELIVSADLGDGLAAAHFGLTVGSKGLTSKDDATTGAGDKIAHYTCSMHPSVKSDEPGKCPICSMDLTPVTKGEQASGVLRLDGERSQRVGVRYTSVARAKLSRSVVAVGEVNADENRLTDITLRTAGWIDRLHVEETGEYVERGQALLELYSPEVLTASEEVLAARRATGTARERLVAGADRKLLLLGVTPGQLRRLVARGKARDRISVSSPTSGYVVEKNVVEGDHVEQGMSLLRIADLSEVWVDAQVYESDLPLVKLGQSVTVTLPFVPGQRFEGKVEYIHPRLDPQTRTVRTRVVLDNPDLTLRPGMYADVRIDVDLGERLVIPQEAVIYSGTRRLVFVDLGEGRLQPKEVEVGVRAAGMIEVLDGLAEGERVVSSGNFLIAAESRIRSATTIWADTPADDTSGARTEPTFDHAHDGADYTCPMHPEVHEHEPGQCPICHMDLEARGGDSGAGEPAPRDREEQTGGTQTAKPSKPTTKPNGSPATEEAETKGDADAVKDPPTGPDGERDAKREPAPTYTCPMHSQVVRDAPGECPICHMKLVEKKGGDR
jgi:Cu(I)/Ag(I) efflux system membrane fusion protein